MSILYRSDDRESLMEHQLEDIIRIFNQCFEQEYNTRLVKGGEEPIYIALITLFTLLAVFTVAHYTKLPIGWLPGKNGVNWRILAIGMNRTGVRSKDSVNLNRLKSSRKPSNGF